MLLKGTLIIAHSRINRGPLPRENFQIEANVVRSLCVLLSDSRLVHTETVDTVE